MGGIANSEAAAYRVIALDDQPEVLRAIARLLRRRGFEIEAFSRPDEALEALAREARAFDAMILDVNMPAMSGLEVLPRAKEIAPDLPVVMLTGDDSAATAVAALKAGAFNYLTKPLDDPDAVALTLTRACSVGILHRRNQDLERRVAVSERFEHLVGATAPMREVFDTIEKLAPTGVNVLVHGESGTGKELAARAIHERSDRRPGPFVALNCGAIPEALIDSELFGHAKGAFTGATGARPGVFAEADGGTLFLDEIGDIPLPVQLRLLRVLQEREVRAVGGTGARAVDVRVIAATHVDLEQAVEDKRFRADLYYRLNVVSLTLPPLRERLDDIPLLAVHLLDKHAARQGRDPAPRFTQAAMDALCGHPWPGNVRELENAVQRALAMSPGPEIDVGALPERVAERPAGPAPASADDEPSAHPGGLLGDLAWADDLAFAEAKKRAQDAFERGYLTRLLRSVGGNVSEAARRAGVDRSNFRRVLGKHDIDPADHRE